MCGRYASTRSAEDLVAEFDAIDATDGQQLRPDYNVAPTKDVYVVRRSRRAPDAVTPSRRGGQESVAPDRLGSARNRSDRAEPERDRSERVEPVVLEELVPAEDAPAPRRVISAVRWGLVPSWASNPSIGARMLNARVESIASKPAFRAAFARRRCLIPADGWFEWTPRENAPGKQAYFMAPADGGTLAFAGLWEVWGSGDDRLYTCTVVTTDAVGPLTAVHDRMPLVLPRERWAAWLGEADGPAAEPGELLAPPAAAVVEALEIRPVGSAVGNVRNNGPELLVRIDPSGPTQFDQDRLNPTLF